MSAVQLPTRIEQADPVLGLAFGALTVVLVVLSGPFGLVAGLATAASWYAIGPPYDVAVGHVTLVGLFPDGIGIESFVIVEATFLAILLVHARATPAPVRFSVVILVSVVLLGGSAWLVVRTQSPWLAAGVLVALFAIGVYAVHRYGRVILGIASEDRDNSHDARLRGEADGEPPTDRAERTDRVEQADPNT